MAERSMAYDHPAYVVPQIYSGNTTVGANGVSQKWAAFTAQRIEAVILGPNVASTSATTPLLYKKSGTSTTTTTLTAISSAATAAARNELSTALSLAQGDQFWVTHGTDATVSLSVAVESYLTPGANVTAP
jgi:hypothetical protein